MDAYSITPGWGLPVVMVFALSALASLFGSGCTANIDASESEFAAEPAPEVCGGAVCFPPTETTVKHWGDGEITLIAFRADDLGCEAPHAAIVLGATESGAVEGAPQPAVVGAPFKSGRMIELQLHAAKAGARLPVVSHDVANDGSEPCVTARSLRVGLDGRPMASEETISGEATVLDLDPHSGRVQVRINARWSSGVSGDLLLEVEGPTTCTAPASI